MAREVKDLLSVADGGTVDAPDVVAIQRRAKRLTLMRGGAVAGVAVLLVAAAVGVSGGLVQSPMPLIGESPELPPAEPTEPDEVDAPETGPPLWTTQLDPEVFGDFGSRAQLVSDGQRLFVTSGHGDDPSVVVALELATGDQVWHTDLEWAAHLHATTGELLFASSQPQGVVALDVVTGEQVWEHGLPEGYAAISAAVSEQTLYLVAGAGGEGDTSPPRVHALSLDQGTLQWSSTLAPGTDPQWSPPTIVEDRLLVAATPANPQVEVGNHVHALRLADGSEAWSVDLGGNQGFTSRATAVSHGLLHVSVRGVGVVTLDIARGAISHTIDDASLFDTRPGVLYVAGHGEPTVVRAVDPRTGEPLDQQPTWELDDDWFEVEVHPQGSELLLPATSTLSAVDPDTGTLAWRHTHETPTYEILVLDGLLITANQPAQLVATRLPAD